MTTVSKNVQKMNKEDVFITKITPLYKGFFALNRYVFNHRRFDGSLATNVSREIFERGHSAILLGYDPVKDSVLLVEQLRIAAMETSKTPWLLELVAGMIEEGESVEDVVRREAQEEAGVTVKRCLPVLSYLVSPGGTTERSSIMVGEIDINEAKGIHGLAEENEDILVHVFSREEAYQLIEAGIVDNAATIISLQWLQINYKKLRKAWAK